MMSTLEDFENAPVGATADGGKWVKFRPTSSDWNEWVKADRVGVMMSWATASNSDLAEEGASLDPLPGVPTSAREALALAWELAHPVKKGQTIPAGAGYLKDEGNIVLLSTPWDWTPMLPEDIRTLDPLPEPEPDWLDAPAVLAHTDNNDTRRVWTARRDGQWASTSHTYTRHWQDLTDVTPLYPKEQTGLNPSKSMGMDTKEEDA